MARPKEFDSEQALDAAIGVFREHGYEGTSAGMLTEAMKIGRQSLYDTFGDKWRLYCASVRRYADAEGQAHLAALRGGGRTIDGIEAMIGRVVAEARKPCLGVGSVCEFGRARPDLTEIHEAAGRVLQAAIIGRLREAQAAGDIARDLDLDHASAFLLANIAGLRIAARGGAGDGELMALGRLALRALL